MAKTLGTTPLIRRCLRDLIPWACIHGGDNPQTGFGAKVALEFDIRPLAWHGIPDALRGTNQRTPANQSLASAKVDISFKPLFRAAPLEQHTRARRPRLFRRLRQLIRLQRGSVAFATEGPYADIRSGLQTLILARVISKQAPPPDEVIWRWTGSTLT